MFIAVILYLQAIMDRFFDPASCRDTTSLAAIRVILQCKQVNKDTSKNYYAISHFLDKVADGYLLTYLETACKSGSPTMEEGNNILLP